MKNYKPTIGLEIHAELETKTKMFCSCLNDPDEKKPNNNVCPICLGHPGTLPVANEEAIKKVIKTGLALNCRIPDYSKFDRKNYFYPDLPKGYQISQLYQPLCREGRLEVDGKKIRIREIHLEEDTGRLVHPAGEDYSLVDFNRAGVPLMELVTEPDLHSAVSARKFAQDLQLILRYLGVSKADMEKGQMRVEANVSVSSDETLGKKVEIKNLNSFRAVERGIEYEIARQKDLLCEGNKVVQETRGWDDIKGKTFSQREKEEAHDYRYFPEPDLPPFHHSPKFIAQIQAETPELPQDRRKRLGKEYGLDEKTIEIFVWNKALGEYFEKAVSELDPGLTKEALVKSIKLTGNYLITDLQGILKGALISDDNFSITPENFADFISLIQKGEISSKIAKMVLLEMFKTGADPSHIIEEKDLSQMTDVAEVEKIINDVVSKNSKAVEDYKKGKGNALQFLIGQVMAKTRGKADPQAVKEFLDNNLTK